jgi:hypothetical protein
VNGETTGKIRNTRSMERIIAFDVRASRFSYVVFEGPSTVLDWGTRSHSKGKHSVLERRLRTLQTTFAPSVFLVRNSAERYGLRQRVLVPPSAMIKHFGRSLPISVRVIADPIRRRFFGGDAKINKYEIAKLVANRFPELSWRLPSQRRPWQTEPSRQSIFDAASLGMIYFSCQVTTRDATEN